ncbi:Thioredoxin [Thermoanaerobacter uzonensis DSM 18761]|uniref:Thioredoxin n=1 Tax=Thermoanaerobacter uzonensis DSM 18761 TaxID=1123369 RepID=A0A1M4YR09_9THEO|nr:thioredoxin family protein [Thermoanaerobacter uzonensis]SHF08200.1 Thioredoxin [Thermoanaerobacter uzonensis DSM 18761]
MSLKDLFEKGLTFDEFIETSEDDITRQRIRERYDKTVLEEDVVQKIASLPKVNILAFAETWCPDSQVNVPIVAKIASYNKTFELKIVKREGNEEYMKPYYVEGKPRIPTFVFMDENFKEFGHWVERPQIVRELEKREVADWKRDYLKGKYDSEIIREIVYILLRR